MAREIARDTATMLARLANVAEGPQRGLQAGRPGGRTWWQGRAAREAQVRVVQEKTARATAVATRETMEAAVGAARAGSGST